MGFAFCVLLVLSILYAVSVCCDAAKRQSKKDRLISGRKLVEEIRKRRDG